MSTDLGVGDELVRVEAVEVERHKVVLAFPVASGDPVLRSAEPARGTISSS